MPEHAATPTDAAAAVAPRPVRSCDGCTLCCKVLSIEALGKPAGAWCVHCKVGSGCTAYDARPTACRVFHCDYLLQPAFTAEWKPSISRLVVTSDGALNRITVHVDPAKPDAWRRSPYYGTLKQWSQHAAANRGQVVVMIGTRAIVIFPNRDVDLGVVTSDELIVTGERRSPSGSYLEAYVVAREADTAAQDQPGASGGPADSLAGRVLRMGQTL
jgi:hypothetical protein